MNSCFHGDDDLYFLTQEHSARRWNKTRAVYAYVYAASQRDGGTALLHQWVIIVSAPAQTPTPPPCHLFMIWDNNNNNNNNKTKQLNWR